MRTRLRWRGRHRVDSGHELQLAADSVPRGVEPAAEHTLPTRRLALALHAPPASFSAPIPVPTSSGFSEVPGCRESYAAVASLVASGRPSPRTAWAEVGRWEVPLAVLEFGGTYQCTRA